MGTNRIEVYTSPENALRKSTFNSLMFSTSFFSLSSSTLSKEKVLTKNITYFCFIRAVSVYFFFFPNLQ